MEPAQPVDSEDSSSAQLPSVSSLHDQLDVRTATLRSHFMIQLRDTLSAYQTSLRGYQSRHAALLQKCLVSAERSILGESTNDARHVLSEFTETVEKLELMRSRLTTLLADPPASVKGRERNRNHK